MDELNWDELLDDIEEQNAVLLLGHDFFPGVQQELANHLKDRLGENLLHHYKKEGLFLFADSESKNRAQRTVSRFFKSYEPNTEILKKIVEIPFPLIVSANPDKNLINEFVKYKVDYQFDYFSSGYKSEEYKIERPKRSKPLIYNLCGSMEDRESLLLDYDDLFKMLTGLLTDVNVPNEVRSPLQKTTTYIFIGFHFERWYTQLFLRYLNMYDNRFLNKNSNYILKTTFSNGDAQKFFLEQFNVKFIGADWSFFDEIHARFSKMYPKKLRELVNPYSPLAVQVIQAIRRADYEGAFQIIDENIERLNQEDKEIYIITKAMHAQYLIDKQEGIVRAEELDIRIARIRKNLWDLAPKL